MERTRYLLADGWTDGGGADAEKGPEGDRASKERFITYWTDGRTRRDAGKRTDGRTILRIILNFSNLFDSRVRQFVFRFCYLNTR